MDRQRKTDTKWNRLISSINLIQCDKERIDRRKKRKKEEKHRESEQSRAWWKLKAILIMHRESRASRPFDSAKMRWFAATQCTFCSRPVFKPTDKLFYGIHHKFYHVLKQKQRTANTHTHKSTLNAKHWLAKRAKTNKIAKKLNVFDANRYLWPLFVQLLLLSLCALVAMCTERVSRAPLF